MSLKIEIVPSVGAVPAAEWNALAGGNPFTQHHFLHLLQETSCATPDTGWTPCHVLLREQGVLQGAVAAYLKTHSRGEFVFDQSWAQAYQQHGLDYYPKLVVSVPFTPVAGPRLLAYKPAHQVLLIQALMALAQQVHASSIHVLFPAEQDLAALKDAGFMVRESVQFHWRNAAYADMDAFLATMAQEKRKKFKQDRKKVQAAGITFSWLEAETLDSEALQFFYRCYQNTYERHWGKPYLSLEFFLRLHQQEPNALMLVLALRQGVPVACALNVRGPDVLYGRYWGCVEQVPGLHFETCYAQSIAYCIDRGLQWFEGGAQGEHKISRGLLPVKTFSAHWVADPRFAEAIAEFLQREIQAVEDYVEVLEQSSPFKRQG
ncbi:GNAT family N-acetyltransferase [Giesbergeria anulus]|uniref:GNAT family N-acetyltransferase n=1 Tax=Giesbergeria anulus TaxID=180197 RepID=A0A1H9K6Q1_9BURK|nr:GNAT family N-acetyltransferase [Giesbergeria anulus]MBX9936727.1 GNAT family N-acetyltransferase [Burkholderiaceae bacterium]SEQ94545.1 hypothetical protein SAMN02982919_01459 [Giesbergeria anulus]